MAESRPQSRSGADKARDFWEEQACRFDDHYPLIASILRERGNQVWLAAECDRLTAENKALIAAASEKQAWIPISERKPEGACLVYLEEPMLNVQIHAATYHPNITCVGGHFAFDCPKVTHWMPLPEAPK